MPGVRKGVLDRSCKGTSGEDAGSDSALHGVRSGERRAEMKHTKFIQDSASAYMIAYNQAMQDTHNPNMAAQIAGVVVMSYMTAFKQEIEQEQQAQTMLGIMLSMVEKAKGENEDGDGE